MFISTEWTILLGNMRQQRHGGSLHNWFISTHWTNLLGKNKQNLGGSAGGWKQPFMGGGGRMYINKE